MGLGFVLKQVEKLLTEYVRQVSCGQDASGLTARILQISNHRVKIDSYDVETRTLHCTVCLPIEINNIEISINA